MAPQFPDGFVTVAVTAAHSLETYGPSHDEATARHDTAMTVFGSAHLLEALAIPLTAPDAPEGVSVPVRGHLLSAWRTSPAPHLPAAVLLTDGRLLAAAGVFDTHTDAAAWLANTLVGPGTAHLLTPVRPVPAPTQFAEATPHVVLLIDQATGLAAADRCWGPVTDTRAAATLNAALPGHDHLADRAGATVLCPVLALADDASVRPHSGGAVVRLWHDPADNTCVGFFPTVAAATAWAQRHAPALAPHRQVLTVTDSTA